MLLYDIIAGLVILSALYSEYQYWVTKPINGAEKSDFIARLEYLSTRIKPVSIIIAGVIYFIVRLKNAW